MPYEFIPVTLGLIFIFGVIAFGLIKKALADQNRLKLRQMVHAERMAAMEKNLPVEGLAVDEELAVDAAEPPANNKHSIVWVRLTALCLGLAFFFGGIGLCIAFNVSPDKGFYEIWTVGFIPAFVGFGLLLFYFFTASHQREATAARANDA